MFTFTSDEPIVLEARFMGREHWRAIRDEAASDLAMAQTEMVKWHMLLARAEETNG
jgi:hypothetical protein